MIIFMTVAAHALAQDRDPEPSIGADIVVTGTKNIDFGEKSGIPIDQVPQSIQIIDQDDLVRSGARTLEDSLRAVPSATTARSRIGGFGGNTLRIRGFAAQQIRNGIFQRFYDSTDPSALSNVERIEVLKGPSAVLYGQSGVGGIVSIITKQPTDVLGGSLALTAGTDAQKMATVDYGGPVTETLGFRVTGEIERSGSFVDFLDVDRENVGVALTWRPGAGISAHVVGEFIHRKTLNNPGLPAVGTVISNGVARVGRSTFLGEPDFSFQENHAPLVQGWVDVRLSDRWTLTPRLQYSEWNNKSRSATLLPPVAGQPTLIQRVGRNAGENDKFYLAQLDLAGEAMTAGIGHTLLFGVEYNRDKVPFRMQPTVPCGIGPIDALDPVYGCGPPTSNFGFEARAKLKGFAFYAQDQIALTPAWNVVAGIRHSRSTNDNRFTTAFFTARDSAKLTNTSWQLGTTYKLGRGVSLFGGYNTGYDLSAVTASRNFDGTAFDPETSDQAEIGVRLTRDNLRASLSAFRVRRNKVAVPDPDNLGFQLQDGQFRTRGIEFEGEWSPRPGWWLQGGYACLDAEVSESTEPDLVGARLAETPKHTVTAATRVTVGQFELRAAANYVGARKVISGGAVTLPDYFVADLGAGTHFGPVRLDAIVTNIFDKTYYYSDNLSRFSIGTEDRVLPGEPRAFSLRAGYSFRGRPMTNDRYRAFWRWHFYAGILVLPFLAWLAITGGLYLFKPEIERAVYGSWITLDTPATALPVSRLIADTERQAQGQVTQVEVPASPSESWRMRVETGDAARTAFVDPASGALLGTTGEGGIMKTVRELHSLAITGPLGNALIEIAAGWAIVLVVTGLVLWWPRDGRPALALRRPTARRRFWRDFHASTGVLASAVILFLAVTGMPWSVVWGANVQRWVGEQGLGRPKAPGPQPWERSHSHGAKAAQTDALPWSLRQSGVPHAYGRSDIGVDQAVAIADRQGLAPPFTIILPLAAGEPYGLSRITRRAQDARAIYIEPGSGRILQDARHAQFGSGAKAIEWGIATHQGQQYGETNRWLMLAGCVALLVLAISSPVMWWKRRTAGRLRTPPRPVSAALARSATAIVILLGLLYPLTGISALLIWLFDRSLLSKGRQTRTA